MTQKVLKVGSSAAVTLSKKALAELGVGIGGEVEVEIDHKDKSVSVRAAHPLSAKDKRIAKLTVGFVDRYRKDLEALAHK